MRIPLPRRWLTLSEALVVAAIIVVLVALLLPATQWVADGSRKFPVRIYVFDASRKIPIEGAKVSLFRAPRIDGQSLRIPDWGYRAPGTSRLVAEPFESLTNELGYVESTVEFMTSASSRQPTPHTHLTWVWVEVHAEEYGTVVVPVRYESEPTAQVREQGQLLVPIGLVRNPSD